MASPLSSNQFNQSNDEDSEKRGGFKLNLNFLKIGSEKKTTKDGQPAKRPGPKPGTKGPASSKRRELNRQAQRTHRERKEIYIKALEDEVLRMKEICSNLTRDKTRLSEENTQVKSENRRLRELLSVNGIDPGMSVITDDFAEDGLATTPMIWYADSNTTTTATSATGSDAATVTALRNESVGSGNGNRPDAPSGASALDYEQAGIDFVLTLESGCVREHVAWVTHPSPLNGNKEPHRDPCGHALMATCPPEAFRGEQQQKSWELSKADLSTLLELSKKLDLDGEVTPVMAWGMILDHPRLGDIITTTQDFVWLTEELAKKAKCYGFGAVMEEFEVRDAIEALLSAKETTLPGQAY
ncbi:AP-1-like transcription factor [Naviculisporaceae sp. PSN 640]